jgi:hypothetical protein
MRLHSFPPSLGSIVFTPLVYQCSSNDLNYFVCFSSFVPKNLGGFILYLIHILIHKYALFHASLFPV